MLSSLIAGLATGEVAAALSRLKRALIAFSLAGVLGLTGLVFLLIAAVVWTARRFGTIEACLGFGVGFLLLAGLIVVLHTLTRNVRTRVARRRRSRDMVKVAAATGLAVLPTILRGRAGPFVLIAPVLAAMVYGIYRENSADSAEDDEH